MRFFLIFFVSCFFAEGFSQNYFSYHQTISRAESEILKEQYQNSLMIYDSLFSEYEFCFAHDRFVALQVATLIRDTARIDDYIIGCLKSGILINYIEQDTITRELKAFKTWDQAKLLQDSLYLAYFKRIDKKLLGLSIELNAIDQHYRDNHENIHWKHPIRRMCWNKRWMREIQNLIDNDLYPVMLKTGYLGEKKIGLTESWMSYAYKNNHIDNYPTRLMFMHYYSNKHRKDYSDFLLGEVRNGNLSAVDYAIIMDFRAKWSDKKAPFFNEWHTCPDKSEKMLQAIENRRKEIGLPTLADNEKMYFRYMQTFKKKECPISYYIKLWNH